MTGHFEATLRSAAARLRSELVASRVTPAVFNAALAQISPRDRDAWLDFVWDIDELPSDTPDLPKGCVPYLPCAAATVLEALQHLAVTCNDVFVDVGSGAGKAALLAHLSTGAGCIGLEVQQNFALTAQARADWLNLDRVRFIAGDAVDRVRLLTIGSVFFLYCPFGGVRLGRFLEGLQDVARARKIRVCCVDMPPLEVAWLKRLPSSAPQIDLYRSA